MLRLADAVVGVFAVARLLVIADAVIAGAFFAMTVALLHLGYRRPESHHRVVYVMVAAPIFAVGVVHALESLGAFRPVPGGELASFVAAITAAGAAAGLVAILPTVLRAPDPRVLERTNRDLLDRMRERERAELEALEANAELEARVKARTRELERSNEELERFAYVASHDLREPLRMVKSYTQLLARRYRGKLDPTADEFIDYAVEGCDRMGDLIHDVLEYSRVGRREQLAFIEADEALAVAQKNLAVAIGESGARITADHLPRLHGRRSDLIALFQNLLSNAIKYRKANAAVPPRIHVGAQHLPSEDILHVRDDGIGLDTAKHGDRIFGMFARLHPRGDYAGTGMGLALCKKIMETHGGRIWVESQPGQGATFYCAFPRRVS
jgi:signal transduction histidine kinase